MLSKGNGVSHTSKPLENCSNTHPTQTELGKHSSTPPCLGTPVLDRCWPGLKSARKIGEEVSVQLISRSEGSMSAKRSSSRSSIGSPNLHHEGKR